jgi:hypothetical protein
LVRLALRDDRRLLSLFIDDAVRTRLTSLAFEKKLNDLLSAGNEAMRLSRNQFWDRRLRRRIPRGDGPRSTIRTAPAFERTTSRSVTA